MLGGYGIGVLESRPVMRRHEELVRYLRLEYAGGMEASAFLAQQAQGSKVAATNVRRRFAKGIRAFGAALRMFATGRRVEIPTAEV